MSAHTGLQAGRRRLARCFTALVAAVVSGAAPAACELSHAELPVHLVNQRPVATLRLNGTEVPLLLDTGAFFSFLSPATAARMELKLLRLPPHIDIRGYTGRVEARKTRVAKVDLLGLSLNDVEFVVGGNEVGSGIAGVLGRNFLTWTDAEYDLAHGVVRLSFPKGDCADTNFAYWAGEAPVVVVVPLARGETRDDTAMNVEVAINGKRLKALLDTGAPRSSLSLRAARRAGIEERDMTPAGAVGGAGEGRARQWRAPIASFELGGEKLVRSQLEVADVDDSTASMLLGLDYFLSHRIYVSRKQRQAYITWNGTPIFPADHGAAGTLDTRYAALPQDLPADDADALARRGAASLAAGNPAKALEDLDRACELAPRKAEYLLARARVHLALRQGPKTVADLDRALELDPAMDIARSLRAGLRVAKGDRPGAEADLAHLDTSVPPSSELRSDMGRAHAALDQLQPALRQFDLWLTHHPKDMGRAGVLNERCWLRMRLNVELPLALQDCQESLKVDKVSAATHDSLGWTQLRLGDARSAQRAFDDALKLQELALALYGRAIALGRLDDAAGAERDLAAARRRQPAIDDEVRRLGFEPPGGARPPP